MCNFEEDVNKLLNSTIKDRYWFANKILYNLCENNQDYRDRFNSDSFVAKLWLIGRSYAAAVERRNIVDIRNLDYNDNFMKYSYDFYYDEVFERIKANNCYFEMIDKLQKIDTLDRDIESIKTILKAHKVLTDIFTNVCGKEKRSLASKYLHFHFPNLFFIFDSRASEEIKKYVKEKKEIKKIEEIIPYDNYDKQYYDLYIRCYLLYKKHFKYADWNKDGIEKYFTRLLDTVLLVSAAKSAENYRRKKLDEMKDGNFDDYETEKKKREIAIEIYKSKTFRDELIEYLEENHPYNSAILAKINERWNKISKEDE